jgi:hypothetical protein
LAATDATTFSTSATKNFGSIVIFTVSEWYMSNCFVASFPARFRMIFLPPGWTLANLETLYAFPWIMRYASSGDE